MANHASSLKRQRQSEKHRLRNRATKSKINTFTKKILAQLSDAKTNQETLLKQFRATVSVIAKAKNTGAMHYKTASRKIARLARLINQKGKAA